MARHPGRVYEATKQGIKLESRRGFFAHPVPSNTNGCSVRTTPALPVFVADGYGRCIKRSSRKASWFCSYLGNPTACVRASPLPEGHPYDMSSHKLCASKAKDVPCHSYGHRPLLRRKSLKPHTLRPVACWAARSLQ